MLLLFPQYTNLLIHPHFFSVDPLLLSCVNDFSLDAETVVNYILLDKNTIVLLRK